jgi:hypothetical protein
MIHSKILSIFDHMDCDFSTIKSNYQFSKQGSDCTGLLQ